MGENTISYNEVRERNVDRFFTAQSGAPATDAQKSAVANINQEIIELATLIDLSVPDGRNKSLALTALEDVSMRSNRGIFSKVG